MQASTNEALPFNQWSNLGTPGNPPPARSSSPTRKATNYMMRFYRVRSP
jgi:hypothetical protein